jgi:hypothetical protein
MTNPQVTITMLNGVSKRLTKNVNQGYNIEGLSSGIYIVTIKTQEHIQQLRLVKL